MAKLIILSIVLVSFIGPLIFASSKQPRRALSRLQALFFLYVLLWAYMCLHWYPTMVVVE
jgi:hypothetical protein